MLKMFKEEQTSYIEVSPRLSRVANLESGDIVIIADFIGAEGRRTWMGGEKARLFHPATGLTLSFHPFGCDIERRRKSGNGSEIHLRADIVSVNPGNVTFMREYIWNKEYIQKIRINRDYFYESIGPIYEESEDVKKALASMRVL